MFARSRSKERTSTRKVTPPSPSYMSSEQFAAYLADLRNTRLNRPGGARPPPASKRDTARLPTSTRPSLDASLLHHQHTHSDASNVSIPASVPAATTAAAASRPSVSVSRPSISVSRPSMSASVSSRFSTTTQGKDYYPDRHVKPLKPSEIVPSATYIERGQRWMEKEEAVSLRQAMEDMDLKDRPKLPNVDLMGEEGSEERRLYEVALDEAAELVWRHQNPGKVPQPGAPYRYKPHMRKDSYAHARTASAGLYGNDVAPTGLARDPSMRSVSGSSTDSDSGAPSGGRPSFASSRQVPGAGTGSRTDDTARRSFDRPQRALPDPRATKSYGSVSGPPSAIAGSRRRSSLNRNISGEIQKPFSGDQIWEEPDVQATDRSKNSTQAGPVQPLRAKPKNPLNRVQFAPGVSSAEDTPPPSPPKVVSKYEIYKNPPSQTRNPQYTTNGRPEAPPSLDNVPRKHGMEIRGEDIREATSMRLKDRSHKLPTPSAVSDNPGRPIVSFDRDWKPPEEATDNAPEESRNGRGDKHSSPIVPGRIYSQQPQQQAQTIPTISIADDSTSPPSATPSSRHARSASAHGQVDGPPVPTISVSDSSPDVPAIVLLDDGPNDNPNIPAIVTPDDDKNSGSHRPLPTPQAATPRIRQPDRHRSHWSPAPRPVGSRATACCHECGGFIEGRFVSLAGSSEKFHPQCFACYSCGTSLEALEISPEPDNYRSQRLNRIARRAASEILPEEPGETMAEDGDTRLRFFCHLDWHELYAPRCKHCKTPIMGEHVVALGAHWHFGHFFCAECGDPFERGMTHIEKDGYAWCVSCQTKRTERRAPKCRKCNTAVIGQYVRALGGEWHDECFRCATCNGGFDDGQIFPVERRGASSGEKKNVVLCTGCMEKELKA
ncbi:hypothetical protein B0H67DRAFT_548473 [Lasiosphaeris hirsuta]|uniref:LIM zinc-binding domain-containing protein n=1 Tax=Lasiosphaeris hirsuta TaxID=260670 RepID=A0AA40BAE8_9PEZI|nr:hypothetical protein B0H67DRAFT_548473 [Lasiosphaeris hirsuta]